MRLAATRLQVEPPRDVAERSRVPQWLALALEAQGRGPEARSVIAGALAQDPERVEIRRVAARLGATS